MSGRRTLIAGARVALVSTAIAALGGCTTLGGNVKGSFSCAAPDGICAPSSSIDDRALAMIAGESGASEAAPAGIVIDPRSRARSSPTAATGPRVPVGQGDPRRTQERVLRIVFQPYIDEFGRLHETSAVHAVVESGAWQQQLLASATPMAIPSVAPRPAGSASLADAIDHADGAGGYLAAVDPNLPDPAVVAAARARAPLIDPVAAIRNDVAARLAPGASHTRPRAVSKTVARPLNRKAGVAPGTTATVTKGSSDTAAAAKSMVAEPAGAALPAKTGSAADAVMRVKVTGQYQAGALAAETASRDAATAGAAPAAKPNGKVPVRAAGFSGTVPEDN